MRPNLQGYVGEIMFLTPKLGCIVMRCWVDDICVIRSISIN